MKRSIRLFITFAMIFTVLLYGAAWLLAGDEDAVVSAQRDMRNLSIKLSIIRISVIGSIIVFGWSLITRSINKWCAVDIARQRVKITAWYLGAEAAILLSLWSSA